MALKRICQLYTIKSSILMRFIFVIRQNTGRQIQKQSLHHVTTNQIAHTNHLLSFFSTNLSELLHHVYLCTAKFNILANATQRLFFSNFSIFFSMKTTKQITTRSSFAMECLFVCLFSHMNKIEISMSIPSLTLFDANLNEVHLSVTHFTFSINTCCFLPQISCIQQCCQGGTHLVCLLYLLWCPKQSLSKFRRGSPSGGAAPLEMFKKKYPL